MRIQNQTALLGTRGLDRDLDCHIGCLSKFWSGCLAMVVEDCLTDGGRKRMATLVKKNKKVSSIELLLLDTLWYLGRGCTFDDIEDCTKVSCEVHRCFFSRVHDIWCEIFVPTVRTCAAYDFRLAKL